MKQELIKQAFKLGNSAGVILPREWNNRRVKVELVEKSINQDIFEILEERNLLKNVIGIFLVGSYARGEETESSDVDILVITDDINKQISSGEYELTLISKEKFEKNIEKSLYLSSLVNEAKTIINNSFIQEYKNKALKINLNKYISELKSIIKINEEAINIDEELKKNVSDSTIYSIILRLRELYLLSCINNKKIPSNKELTNIIKKITSSTDSYEAYLRVKNNKPSKSEINITQARKLIEYLKLKTKYLEHGKKN